MDELWMKIRAEKTKHEYTKYYFNTNCRELPVNYSKIINDYSCVFLAIRVEKEKTRIHMNTHEYEKINL